MGGKLAVHNLLKKISVIYCMQDLASMPHVVPFKLSHSRLCAALGCEAVFLWQM